MSTSPCSFVAFVRNTEFKEGVMKKIAESSMKDDDMRPEYDFSIDERGRYAHRLQRDTIASYLIR
jgi:hypothetical protein